MNILEWTWKNYKSYGSVPQTIRFTPNRGELILLIGENGAGKCVEKNTVIDIEIDNLEINTTLIEYLATTDVGRNVFAHIKENNSSLYEKIRDFRKNT